MRQNISTPEIQALDREWQPKLAAADDEIMFNPGLFKRIEAVYRSLAGPTLTAEQKRLAERTYDSFVRRGARLNGAGQGAAVGDQPAARRAVLGVPHQGARRREHVDRARSRRRSGRAAGVARLGRQGRGATSADSTGKWAIVNTRSSVDPFLTFSTRRDLREKVWKKFKSRGDNGDANDTKATIASIVKLRAERARLLGFASHAHWRMDDTMARDPKAAQALMMRVWPAAVARVKEEVADMQAIAAREGRRITIEPWDYLFYAEKVRKARYDLDQAS